MAAPGHPDAATSVLPTVTRCPQPDGTVTVTLSLAEQVDMLVALSRAIDAESLLLTFVRLAYPHSPDDGRSAAIHALLTRSQAVRDALTLTFSQSDAEDLAAELFAASDNLPCQEQTEPCDGQAVAADDGLCLPHAEAHAALDATRKYHQDMQRARAARDKAGE